MLDIKLLREDPETFKARVKSRGGDAWKLIDEILECDEKRRSGETEKQSLQADRKRISKDIGALKKEGKDSSAIEAQVREIGEKIKEIGEAADAADARQRELLLQVPNVPHENCPPIRSFGSGEVSRSSRDLNHWITSSWAIGSIFSISSSAPG